MSLKIKIDQDFVTSYKEKSTAKISLLRLLKSAIKNAEIAKKADLGEEEVIRIIRREIKQREESAGQFSKGGRDDLAEKEQIEIDLLNGYLPAEPADEEISQIISQADHEYGPFNPQEKGRLIGATMSKLAGRENGSRVVVLVEKYLK